MCIEPPGGTEWNPFRASWEWFWRARPVGPAVELRQST